MFDVIVVGTDGSGTASVAMQKAIDLAKKFDATLHIVHAHHLVSTAALGAVAAGSPTFDLVSVNEGIEADSRNVCARAAAEAEKAGVKCETHQMPGDAADALVDVAEEVNADLLVLGNRGMTGARRFVLGSVPNKVSHHCPCSLLIVDTRA
jgi:nucleotide-binding universal stress UspA family protein